MNASHVFLMLRSRTINIKYGEREEDIHELWTAMGKPDQMKTTGIVHTLLSRFRVQESIHSNAVNVDSCWRGIVQFYMEILVFRCGIARK